MRALASGNATHSSKKRDSSASSPPPPPRQVPSILAMLTFGSAEVVHQALKHAGLGCA